MKKRNFRLFSFAILFALGVSSCGFAPSGGEGGDPDLEKRQKEIYELYRAVGGEMTYEQWLNSIRGENGSTILFGEGLPSSNLGKVGDGYLDTSTWDVYYKTTSGWQKMGNIMGNEGAPGKDGVSITGISKTGQSGNVDIYTISYSDGHTSTFTVTNGVDGESIQGEPGKDGHTPVITIVDNVWYVDGVSTGISAKGPQGEPGKDGHTPVITIEGGYWYIDGVSTGIKAVGEDGHTPEIKIVDGYWYIDNVSTGIKAEGIDGENGKDGHTPVITIVDGYWYIDGVSTGVKASGEQGEAGKTAWSNTILPSSHGYITVSVGSALEGEDVTFYAYHEEGYSLSELYLNNVNVINDFDFSTNSITVPMVEHGYVVRGVFSIERHVLQFLNYEGWPIEYTTVPHNTHIYSEEYVLPDNPHLVKPSTDEYDYVFVGWKINGYDLPASFEIIVDEDMTFSPRYEEVEKVDIKTKYGVDHEGTLEDPFTNEDAIKVAKALADNPKSSDASKTFYMKGIIDRFYNAPENRSDGKVSFYLVPSLEGGEQFEVYAARAKDLSEFTFDTLYPGLEIVASGRLTMYNGQAETDSYDTYIESVNYICEPPVMHEYSVSVNEAIEAAQLLQDGDSSYDTYHIIGYVVNMTVNKGIVNFLLSDSLTDTTNVFVVSPYYQIDPPIINEYFTFGAKITITDHIRNYHGQAVTNKYYVEGAALSVIDYGSPWPGLPTGVTFYDMEDNMIDRVSIGEGETVTIKYVLEGDEPYESMFSFVIGFGNGINVNYGDGLITFTCDYLSVQQPKSIFAKNIFGETIGLLYVDLVMPYVAPDFIEYYDQFGTTFSVGDTFSANVATVHAYPSGCTVEGYTLSSSNTDVAVVVEGTNNTEIEFVGEGEVEIRITETRSGVYTTVLFEVVGLDETVVNFLDGVISELDTLTFEKNYSPSMYTIVANCDKTDALDAYVYICEKYDALSETLLNMDMEINDTSYIKEEIHSSMIHYGPNSYVLIFAEVQLSTDGAINNNYAFQVVKYDDVDSGTLEAIQNPSYFYIGRTYEFFPKTSNGNIIPYFVEMKSSDTSVAVVEDQKSNKVTIVGDGTCTITCLLTNGTELTYEINTSGYAPDYKPDLDDAILLDYSNCGYWSATMNMMPSEETKLYLLPSDYIYLLSEYSQFIKVNHIGDDVYSLQAGPESYMVVYFTIDENGVMGEVTFTPLENPIVGHTVHDSQSIDIDIELGENNLAKVTFGEPISADVYTSYLIVEENKYLVASPMGQYLLTVTEDGVEVSTYGGGEPVTPPPAPVSDWSEEQKAGMMGNLHGEVLPYFKNQPNLDWIARGGEFVAFGETVPPEELAQYAEKFTAEEGWALVNSYNDPTSGNVIMYIYEKAVTTEQGVRYVQVQFASVDENYYFIESGNFLLYAYDPYVYDWETFSENYRECVYRTCNESTVIIPSVSADFYVLDEYGYLTAYCYTSQTDVAEEFYTRLAEENWTIKSAELDESSGLMIYSSDSPDGKYSIEFYYDEDNQCMVIIAFPSQQ